MAHAAALLSSPAASADEIEAALEAVVRDGATDEFAKAFGPRRLMKALASGRLTDRAAELADELLDAEGAASGLAPSLDFTEVLHREELFPDDEIDLSSQPPPAEPPASDERRLRLRLERDGCTYFLPSCGRVVRDASSIPPSAVEASVPAASAKAVAAEAAAEAEAAEAEAAEEAPTLRLSNPSRRYRLGSEIECKVWPSHALL